MSEIEAELEDLPDSGGGFADLDRRWAPERIQDCYRTPPELLAAVRADFGLAFTLDAAADESNAVCNDYLSGPHEDAEDCACGLCARWEGVVWCNPPYSDVAPWVAKAVISAEAGATVAMLLLADTSTRWFALAAGTAETYLLTPGRVSFLDPVTGQPARGNRIGSVLFIWRPRGRVARRGHIALWDWRP